MHLCILYLLIVPSSIIHKLISKEEQYVQDLDTVESVGQFLINYL